MGYIWIAIFLLWDGVHFLDVLGWSVQLSYASPRSLYFPCVLLFSCGLLRSWSHPCSLSSQERKDGSWHFKSCWKFCTPFPSSWWSSPMPSWKDQYGSSFSVEYRSAVVSSTWRRWYLNKLVIFVHLTVFARQTIWCVGLKGYRPELEGELLWFFHHGILRRL